MRAQSTFATSRLTLIFQSTVTLGLVLRLRIACG